MPDLPDSLPCKYKVGFLFKRICGRLSRLGCTYCQGQPIREDQLVGGAGYDPYFRDRSLYYSDHHYYHDFTDYDARSLAHERDTDYENDLDAS